MAAKIPVADKALPLQHLLCKGVSRLGKGFDDFVTDDSVPYDATATASIVSKVETSPMTAAQPPQPVAERNAVETASPASNLTLRAFSDQTRARLQQRLGICLWLVRTFKGATGGTFPGLRTQTGCAAMIITSHVPSSAPRLICVYMPRRRISMSGLRRAGARPMCGMPCSAWSRH